ncbi:hypothetical protein ONZ45_g6201 [Pleurotus djamor]|nr:hypothetical protein ONZ45_g6201 [Pleurotus djamor]
MTLSVIPSRLRVPVAAEAQAPPGSPFRRFIPNFRKKKQDVSPKPATAEIQALNDRRRNTLDAVKRKATRPSNPTAKDADALPAIPQVAEPTKATTKVDKPRIDPKNAPAKDKAIQAGTAGRKPSTRLSARGEGPSPVFKKPRGPTRKENDSKELKPETDDDLDLETPLAALPDLRQSLRRSTTRVSRIPVLKLSPPSREHQSPKLSANATPRRDSFDSNAPSPRDPIVPREIPREKKRARTPMQPPTPQSVNRKPLIAGAQTPKPALTPRTPLKQVDTSESAYDTPQATPPGLAPPLPPKNEARYRPAPDAQHAIPQAHGAAQQVYQHSAHPAPAPIPPAQQAIRQLLPAQFEVRGNVLVLPEDFCIVRVQADHPQPVMQGIAHPVAGNQDQAHVPQVAHPPAVAHAHQVPPQAVEPAPQVEDKPILFDKPTEPQPQAIEREIEGFQSINETGKYLCELHYEIGRGAFGKVYCGMYTSPLGKGAVAVKMYRKFEISRNLVKKRRRGGGLGPLEIKNEHDMNQIITALGSNFLVPELASFGTYDSIGFVMPLYSQTLSSILALFDTNNNFLDMDSVTLFSAQLLLGLEALHSHNIYHCDIKPENIFMSPAGNLVLGDFGLALQVAPDVTIPGPFGTPAFSAPEVWGDFLPGPADLWAYGAVVLQMLVGTDQPVFSSRPEKREDYLHVWSLLSLNPKATKLSAKYVSSIINTSANHRPTFSELKQHEFFTFIDWNKVNDLGYKHLIFPYPVLATNVKGINLTLEITIDRLHIYIVNTLGPTFDELMIA